MQNILIGNGFSVSINESFNYASLRRQVQGALDERVERLFKEFETDDFEELIHHINHAKRVLSAIGENYTIDDGISSNIRYALRSAISEVLPQSPVSTQYLVEKANEILTQYESVFTTNYDTLLYWARSRRATSGENHFNTIDYFSRPNGELIFDQRQDSEIRNAYPDHTQFYFLHGALFLYEEQGITKKIEANEANLRGSILSMAADEQNEILVVTEGNSIDKLTAIIRNDYLKFCYDKLMQMSGSLDIYGHNLSEQADQHVIDAINQSGVSNINYYSYQFNQLDTKLQHALEAEINNKFPKKSVSIKDSSEHGLASCPIDIAEGFGPVDTELVAEKTT